MGKQPSVRSSQSGRRLLKPIPLTLGTLALLIFVFVFWHFCIGFAQGLRSASAEGSLPRQTLSLPAISAATPSEMPTAAAAPNQPADETYVLPPIKKGGPYIDTDTVDSIQRAAEALTKHTDLGVKLTTPAQWRFMASVLWGDVPTLRRLSHSAPPAERVRYGKWATDLAHLCHLVRSEPDDPKLQHYYVKIISATSSQAQ